jgi:hypothetical protein
VLSYLYVPANIWWNVTPLFSGYCVPFIFRGILYPVSSGNTLQKCGEHAGDNFFPQKKMVTAHIGLHGVTIQMITIDIFISVRNLYFMKKIYLCNKDHLKNLAEMGALVYQVY